MLSDIIQRDNVSVRNVPVSIQIVLFIPILEKVLFILQCQSRLHVVQLIGIQNQLIILQKD